jgi:hypothetical protein
MTSLSSGHREEHIGKNKAKRKTQKAKPRQAPQLSRKAVFGVILLPFALCVLPFDLLFGAVSTEA